MKIFKTRKKTIIIALLAILIIAAVSGVIKALKSYNNLEPYIRQQIEATIKYVPGALVSYPFKAKTSDDVLTAKEKAGGFIKGVCHANDNYEQIKNAGIEWNRADIPFPFDSDGNIRQDYINFKERMQRFADNGINIMAVTPYPGSYIDYGVDPRLPENEDRIKEIAVFMITDLQGAVGALQISNELFAPRFKYPMTSEEAVRFIGITLESVYPVRGDILVGYNTAGPQMDQHMMLKPYLEYCDYVGVDIYVGCFFEFANWMSMYDWVLASLWSYTGKPLILCEFGYISGGERKTEDEKQAILERYGVSSEREARENIEAFIKKLPENMRGRIEREASGDLGRFIFNPEFSNHLYAELPPKVVAKGYPHTPEGQAKFYTDIIERLAKKEYLIGAFAYCYSDSASCYYCGQPDCPVETKWGLVTEYGVEKPSYYAVREAFDKIK